MQQVQEKTQEKDKYTEYTYSADTSKIMSILVKSIYTNKDIFLRELISNASDAIGKAIIVDNKYSIGNEIRISFKKDLNQLIIQDSGIGFTKQDFIDKIGSIGTSGTKQFSDLIEKSNGDKLIGQFGVGFYSVYLVASCIKILTIPILESGAYEWISDSESTYSIKNIESNEITSVYPEFTRGTKIILTLNSDSQEYLNQDKLIEIIKTHSSYIQYPIMFLKHIKISDSNNINQEKLEWVKLNWIPLWAQSKSTLTHSDYVKFYLDNIQDNLDQQIKEPPIIYKHFDVEGAINFTGLLYIPAKAPFNLFEPSKRGQSLKLYTKNVLVTSTHKDLYPKWMEFIKGIVETSDIELNVSRQTVQNTLKLRKISNQLIKKTIEMIEELAINPDTYFQFYKEFSCSLKNGIHEEYSRETSNESERMMGNQFGKRMMKLLRYHTSHNRFIGFDDYVKGMKSEQKAIYYIAGDKKEVLKSSPFMDKLKQVGYEVLYWEEPIDEYIKGFLTEYKVYSQTEIDTPGEILGIHDHEFSRFKEPDLMDLNTKVFVDVSRDKLLIPGLDTDLDIYQGIELCARLKELYEGIGINFFEVKLDEKFTSVPAIIVNHVHLSAQLEKLLSNNPGTKRNEQYKPVFERKDMLISNSNNVSQYLYKKLCVEQINITDSEIIKIARYIYSCALLAGGYELDDSNSFVKNSIEYLCLSF